MNQPELTQQNYEINERELCKRDIFYFVDEYVKIEDRDKPDSIAIKFELWPRQKTVLSDFLAHRLLQILKARQLGLTWLALAYAVWCMIFKAGFSVIALSKTDDDAKELVRRAEFILNNLPKWIAPKWIATKETLTIYHKDPSVLQSFPASQNAGRSFTANLVILDEWAFQQWAREIWKAAYPSINRPTGGQVIGLSTIKRGTLFEEKWLDKDSNFHKIFLPGDSDPRRDSVWYENTKLELKDDMLSEYPATVEEALSIPGGAFFTEFRSHIHLRDPLTYVPEWYNRYRFMDYGLDMLACYFCYVDNKGFARIYKEIHKPDLVISEAAYEILKASGCKVPETVESWNALKIDDRQKIAGKGDKFSCTFAPPDLFNKSNHTGRSGADVWYDNGITLTKSKNDFEAGCLAVSNWLHPITLRDEQTGEEYQTAKLTIDKNCAPDLIYDLLNIQKDKHNPKVYAKQPHILTHGCDALRYFCAEVVYESTNPKNDDRPNFMREWSKREKKKGEEYGYLGV
jgi:hypothetical protein